MASDPKHGSARRPRAKDQFPGAYSRDLVRGLAKIDGRTKAGKLMAAERAMLIHHLGGRVSLVQRALIEQAVQLKLRLGLLDKKFVAAGGEQTLLDSRTYLAWSNTYQRLLQRLGLTGPTDRAPSLAEILAAAPQKPPRRRPGKGFQPKRANGATVPSEAA